mgnify:CR=1 FL=1
MISGPFGCRTELYPFQKEGVRLIDGFDGRAILGDSMGLGKSVQAFAWGNWRLKEGEATVIVCPATLKEHWKREIKTHFGRAAVVLGGRKPDPTHLQVPWPRPVFIINYDVLGGRQRHGTWAECLNKNLNLAYLILDECHYLASSTTQRTKAVRQLADGVPHLVAMSGTPLVNQPTELWPTLNLIDCEAFPNFRRFAARYSRPEFTPWGVKYKGARRLKELHSLLKSRYMVRRLKKDVLTQLPPKVRSLVPLALTKPEWQEYKRAETDFIAWMKKTHPHKAEKARRAERLVKFNYLKKLIGELKVPHVREWVENFLEDSHKLILFTTYRASCDSYTREFAPASVKVDGGVTGRHRQDAIDRFQRDRNCRLFVGNIRAAGVGWNGTVTDSVAFAEFGWTPGEHTQAEDRPHRIGQTNVVNVYYLFVPGTLESRLLTIIQEKQKSLDGALDGLGDGEGDFKILDLLENAMLGRK